MPIGARSKMAWNRAWLDAEAEASALRIGVERGLQLARGWPAERRQDAAKQSSGHR